MKQDIVSLPPITPIDNPHTYEEELSELIKKFPGSTIDMCSYTVIHNHIDRIQYERRWRQDPLYLCDQLKMLQECLLQYPDHYAQQFQRGKQWAKQNVNRA